MQLILVGISEQGKESICLNMANDVKGDLSGIAEPGLNNPKIKQRYAELKIKLPTAQGCPVQFWDIYGETGHPLSATISEMGQLLLGRLLNANDVQQGVLNAAFSYADDQGMLLLDLKDLRALLDWLSENKDTLKTKYGNISSASIGSLQRGLLALEEAGGDKFFREPAVKLQDLLAVDNQNNGIVNILDARKLINDSRLYSTFLLWLLSELFECLPEVGDIDKPKLVFFFDEAHLLFKEAPPVLLDKIEQVVRLIRSKGVGIYFVTQSPLDIPETVLGQLGNRVQHALRAFTPKDQKAVKVAAQTFRPNPNLNTEQVISELAVGEALVSFLDPTGTPNIVQKTQIIPPVSEIGAISDQARADLVKRSKLYGVYEQVVDRESAYEMLQKKAQSAVAETETPAKTTQETEKTPVRKGPSMAQTILKTTVNTLGSRAGQQIIRGILGSIFGNNKKR